MNLLQSIWMVIGVQSKYVCYNGSRSIRYLSHSETLSLSAPKQHLPLSGAIPYLHLEQRKLNFS